MKFRKFVKKNPGIFIGAPIVAGAFLITSQGGENFSKLDELYTGVKDTICEQLDLDCTSKAKTEEPTPPSS